MKKTNKLSHLITRVIEENKEESLLIVCSYSVKSIILNEYKFDTVQDITYMTINELITKLTFGYKDSAVYEVMEEFNLDYDVALMYLNNLKYLRLDSDKLSKAECDKYNMLHKVKDFLKTKDLLVNDNYFTSFVMEKKVVIIGEDISKENEKFLADLKYELIKPIEIKKEYPIVYKCKNFEDELRNALDKISELIVKGISFESIKLCGISEENYFLTETISSLYNIPINISKKDSLYSFKITKEIIELLFTGSITEEYLKSLKTEEKDIYNHILDIFNEFDSKDFEKMRNVIITRIKNTFLSRQSSFKGISIISEKDIWLYEDAYIFVFGFNQGLLPVVVKDEDYFDDVLKNELGIRTSVDKNIYNNERLLVLLKSNNQITISYRELGDNEGLYPSSLIESMKMETISYTNMKTMYSDNYNKLLLTRYLDRLVKYGDKNEEIFSLAGTYDINYLNYTNDYKKISQELIDSILNNKVSLSYTKVDSYYKCPFSYFIKYLMKLDTFQDTFTLFIGNLFHYVLSKAFCDDFNFENEYQYFINNTKYELDEKEKFLLIKLKKELMFIIDEIKVQMEQINYKDAMYEEKIKVNEFLTVGTRKYETTFEGIVDKILYKTVDGVDYIVVIDYKTGELDINLDLVNYGLSLQLPVYLFLASKSSKFTNMKVFGFYLQNILHNELKVESEVDYLKQKKNNLKLAGYSLDSFPDDVCFDSGYKDNSIIKGMKIKKDGNYYNYAKVLTEEEIKSYEECAKDKINTAFIEIINGNFRIRPKKQSKKLDSCAYCTFSDICYHTYKDYEEIDEGDDTDA